MSGAEFLDLDFDTTGETAMVETLRGRTAGAPFAWLVTPNVDHIVRLSRHARGDAVWRAYDGAAWCLCDSRILARLAAFYGVRLAVVPGSDLTAHLVRDILDPGDRLCLIGGRKGDASLLRMLRPDVTVIQHVPPMALRDDRDARAAAARFAEETGARFTLIAVGSPQQELVAAAMGALPGASGTALCVGASIDFLLGHQKRAPRWMQRASLEWLHRLASNPARLWRRYLIEGPRIFMLARRWAKRRK